MSKAQEIELRGACGCGATSYRLRDRPMFTHCCHCTWCQRETGSAFALNALIETSKVELEKGNLETRELPSNSGGGQTLIGCPSCKTVLWSHYSSAREAVAFVRVGTLEESRVMRPDLHIFLGSKLPWVEIPSDQIGVQRYYRQSDHWTAESIGRYTTAIGNCFKKHSLVWS